MWQAVESGTVLIAEEDCPARKFADTEFYNDWASPTERHRGSSRHQNRWRATRGHPSSLHYPLSRSGSYDRPAAEVLTRIRNNLRRSVDLGRLLRKRTEDAVAQAALVERACCAAFWLAAGFSDTLLS